MTCEMCAATESIISYERGQYCPECLQEMQEHHALIEDLQRSLEPHLKTWIELHKSVSAMFLEDALVGAGDKLVQGDYAKALVKEVLS